METLPSLALCSQRKGPEGPGESRCPLSPSVLVLLGSVGQSLIPTLPPPWVAFPMKGGGQMEGPVEGGNVVGLS